VAKPRLELLRRDPSFDDFRAKLSAHHREALSALFSSTRRCLGRIGQQTLKPNSYPLNYVQGSQINDAPHQAKKHSEEKYAPSSGLRDGRREKTAGPNGTGAALRFRSRHLSRWSEQQLSRDCLSVLVGRLVSDVLHSVLGVANSLFGVAL
jgi:hypothetical protein